MRTISKRWLLLGTVVIVVVAAVLAGKFLFAGTPARASTQPGQVTVGDIQAVVLSSGALQPAADINLTFGTAGTLSQLKVKPGDTVSKGQVIAALDTRDLQLAVTQAQSSVSAAQTKLDALKVGPTDEQKSAARLKVLQAQANLNSAQSKLDTLKAGLTPAQLSAAKLKLSQAQATVDKAKSSSALQVQQAQLSVNSAQRAQLNAQDKYNTVAAPLLDSKGNLLPKLPQDQINTYNAAFRALQDAKDNFTKAQLGLQDAQAQQTQGTSQAQGQLDDATLQYQATIAGASQSDIAAAQTALDQAKAQLDDANLQYQSAAAGPTQLDIDTAQAAVDQAKSNLESTKLKLQNADLVAPFAGVVAAVPVIEGQTVTANANIAELVNMDAFHLDMNVSESDIGQIKLNQPVDVTFDALGGTVYTGTVTYVAPVAQVQQGVVSYPATVTLDPKAAGSALKPGMSATASVIVQQDTNALLVPNRAVRTEGRQKVVYIMGPGSTQIRVPVQTGISDDQSTEVLGDTPLREGDSVAIQTTTGTTTTNRTGGGGGLINLGGGGGRRTP